MIKSKYLNNHTYVMKFAYFILAIIILSSFTSATLGTFKQGECVNIKTILNSSAVTLSTLSYPNNSLALTGKQMTSIGKTFNYSFCDTNSLGTYNYDYNDTEGNVYVNDFIITPTGYIQTTSQGMGSISYLLIILILTGSTAFIGMNLVKKEGFKVMGIFLIFLAIILSVYDVWLGYEYHRNFTGLSNSSMPETIFFIFLLVLVLGFLVFLAMLFLRWKEVLRWFKREITSKDDDWDGEEDLEVDEWTK